MWVWFNKNIKIKGKSRRQKIRRSARASLKDEKRDGVREGVISDAPQKLRNGHRYCNTRKKREATADVPFKETKKALSTRSILKDRRSSQGTQCLIDISLNPHN